MKFGFSDLTGKDGGKILGRLHALIGKESLLGGGDELKKEVVGRLAKGRNIGELYQDFVAACAAFEKRSKTYQSTFSLSLSILRISSLKRISAFRTWGEWPLAFSSKSPSVI